MVFVTVGLGPSDATRACERVSLAIVCVPQRSRGTGPRATIVQAASLHRRARACPSPSFVHADARGGQAPALRLSRPSPLPRRARACPSPCCGLSDARGGQAPALRFSRPPPFPVGRGPVPRRAAVYRTLAGDRPPRYGENDGFRSCSSGAPAPDPFRERALPNYRVGPDAFPVGGTSLSRYEPHRDQEVSPTGKKYPTVHYSIAFVPKSNEKYPNARTIDKRQHSKNEPFHNSVV